MPTEEITEAKVAEAAHAAAVAHEANSNAREAQMHETLVKALREVLVDGDDSERPMLIKRIPFICTDIVDIKKELITAREDRATVKSDLKWLKWIGTGFVAAGGLLALKQLGL